MVWFDVVGNSLAFIGSVILSADLLKSREQVQDENATYFDANPYTTKSGLESIPAYLLAFFLIVTGFAVTLGGNIGEATSLGLFDSILISFMTAFGGYLVIVLIYRLNSRRHRIAKAKLKVRVFYESVKSLVRKYEKYVLGRPNEKALFAAYKPGDIKSLEDRLGDMTTQPKHHMKGLVASLEKKKTASTFVSCLQSYLEEQGYPRS